MAGPGDLPDPRHRGPHPAWRPGNDGRCRNRRTDDGGLETGIPDIGKAVVGQEITETKAIIADPQIGELRDGFVDGEITDEIGGLGAHGIGAGLNRIVRENALAKGAVRIGRSAIVVDDAGRRIAGHIGLRPLQESARTRVTRFKTAVLQQIGDGGGRRCHRERNRTGEHDRLDLHVIDPC